MKVLLVAPGEVPTVTEVEDSLQAMQKVVGGCIQAIYPFPEPVALLCNDEGKLLGLPLNRGLRGENGTLYDVIAGTFFLCGAPPDRDSFVSLTEEQIQRYQQRFQTPEIFLRVGDSLLCLPQA
jgi:hypothetical protein